MIIKRPTLFIALAAALVLAAAPARSEDQMVLGQDGRLALGSKAAPEASAIRAGNEPTLSSASMKTAGILLMLMGMAGAALLWARRQRNGGSLGRKAEEHMALIERLAVGPRRELLLVRAGNRVLVLASLQQELKLVSSMPASSLEEGLVPVGAGEPDFAQLLGAAARHPARAPAAQPSVRQQAVAEAYAPPRAAQPARQAAPRVESTSPLDLVEWPELPSKA